MTPLLLAVPLAPLLIAGLIAAMGRRLPDKGGWLMVLGTLVPAMSLPFLHSSGASAGAIWFSAGGLELTLSLHVDGLAWWTATVVAWVALAVNLYAVRYMAEEAGRTRFFAWMSFFAGSMLTLVLSGSLLLLFAAWEGVGLASFALIAQRHREDPARRAAVNALLMTRLGDFGLLLGWLIALTVLGTTDIQALLDGARAGRFQDTTLTLLAMLFFAAAVGKSAQLPLTAWLPDAMVGPTPVSALIHSATMVAAGVYLVLRLFPLFEAAPHALETVLWTGGLTAVFAAVVATAQNDLKRILAWSTVSQLGEMFLALGLAGPVAAALHLTTHATFKSCLFLGAGAVDHAIGARELSRLGGLYRAMPWTAGAFAAAALSLAGFPLLSGYWSEEAIVQAAAAKHPGWAIVMLGLIALAGVYIGRAAMATFGPWRGSPQPEGRHASWIMLVPMLALAAAAVVLGWLVKKPIEHVLPFPSPQHHVSWAWTAGAVLASLTGLGFGAWRVWRTGPVPALGNWASVGGSVVHRAASAASDLGWAVSSIVRAIEATLDDAARRTRGMTDTLAGWVKASEDAVLDRGARGVADATLKAAHATAWSEDRGFWWGNDRFAHTLNRVGAALRPLESGKVFLYSAGVFGWVLLAGTVIGLVAWLT